MLRILPVFLCLFFSSILYGQSSVDTVAFDVFSNIGFELVDKTPYYKIVMDNIKSFPSEGGKAGFIKIAEEIESFYDIDNGDRILFYPNLEFFALLQDLEKGTFDSREEEFLINYLSDYFSGRIENPESLEVFKKSKESESFYLRLQLFSSFMVRNTELMFKYLEASLNSETASLAAMTLKAEIDLVMGKYESGMQWSSRSILLWSEYAYGYMIRGICHIASDMRSEAKDDFLKAISLFPENAIANMHLGIICQDEGRHSESILYYRQALAIDPSQVWLYNNLGTAFAYLDQLDSAMFYLEKASVYQPDDPNIYVNIGDVYYDRGEYEVAKYIYTKALDIDPLYIRALTAHANVHVKTGDLESAIAEFEMILSRDSSDVYSCIRIGDCYSHMEACEKAVLYYDRAVNMDSSAYDLQRNFAYCYMVTGDYPKAITSFELSLANDSTDSNAWSNLGWTYYLVNEFQKSLDCSNKSLALDSGNLVPIYNAALATLRLGRVEEAYEMYEEAYIGSPEADIEGAVSDLNELIAKKIMVKEARYILKDILKFK